MASNGRYFQLDGPNANSEKINDLTSDLTDILQNGILEEGKSAVVLIEGDGEEPAPDESYEQKKAHRNHFELGEAGGGLDTKPTYYTRTFDSSVQNVPDGTGRYIEIETQPNPTQGTWGNPRYPSLKMNDPIYIGTKVKKQTIIVEGESVEVDVPGQNYLMISDESKTELRDGAEVQIAGKAKIIIGDTDPMLYNSTTNWNPTTPGQTCGGETVYGPLLRFHGTSCIDIDDGYLRKTPTLNLHGGLYIDICDGSQANGTYYTNIGRHNDAPSIRPWGTGNGPVLHMHDNACLVMDAGCLLNMNSRARIFASGTADIKFDGSADVFFSGSSDFDMHGGTFLVTNGSFKVHGGDFICEGGTVHYGGRGQHDFINNGYVHITNDDSSTDRYCSKYIPSKHSGLMQIDIHAAPSIQIEGFTQIQMHGYALHRLENASMFQMYEYAGTTYSPRIDVNSNQLEFFTKGAEIVDGGNDRSYCRGIYPVGVDAQYVKTREQRQASGILGGNSHISIDGFGSTFIQFTNNGGDFTEYYVMGTSFTQYTGREHTERHDESVFIMRGLAPTEDKDHNPLPSWYEGHVPQASLYKSHLGKTWGRGEINPENGPDVELFDNSRFHMHGIWTDGTVKNGSVEFETEDTISSITDIQNCQDYQDTLTALNMDVVDYTDAHYSQQAGTNKYTVTGLEYKLITWSEHPTKNADNPVVEFIENAEVRCMGDTKLILTDSQRTIDGVTYNEGLTIAVGNDSVTFSIADLLALKNMIPPVV